MPAGLKLMMLVDILLLALQPFRTHTWCGMDPMGGN